MSFTQLLNAQYEYPEDIPSLPKDMKMTINNGTTTTIDHVKKATTAAVNYVIPVFSVRTSSTKAQVQYPLSYDDNRALP